MVVVSKIDYDTLLNLGFESRSQATRAYKGLKSLRNETEEEYIERTYNQVKHIIYQNKLRKLEEEEKSNRYNIIVLEIDFRNNNLNNDSYVYRDNKRLQTENRALRESNSLLMDEILRLRNNFLQSDCDCAEINTGQIYDLKTKRLNKCRECPICNENISKKEIVYDTCHIFHIRCLTLWLIKNTTCPCCRSDLI